MASNHTIVTHRGRVRERWDPTGRSAAGAASARKGGPSPANRLSETAEFGSNPGSLRMLSYAPKDLAAGSALVVVLHGCTQNAKGYDAHAGWTSLADELGFAVLYPEQTSANNPNGCFNWFLAADKARGLGEARSISEMVETMIARHRIDASRVFVTGLSAGGAMAAELLADYPEVFSAGAIIAGLPCGAAASMPEAFSAMSRPTERAASALGDAVRASSSHTGPWPRVTIWHGTADATVAPRNADELVKQWLDVHGAPIEDFRDEVVDGHRRRVWSVGGNDVVESILIAGMGHGTPLDGRLGERKGPFMLEAGVSSTRRTAAFFGLGEAAAKPTAKKAEPARDAGPAPDARGDRTGPKKLPLQGEVLGKDTGRGSTRSGATQGTPSGGRFDVGAVIAKALKSAGLMK